MKRGFENGAEIVYVKCKGHRRSKNYFRERIRKEKEASSSWIIIWTVGSDSLLNHGCDFVLICCIFQSVTERLYSSRAETKYFSRISEVALLFHFNKSRNSGHSMFSLVHHIIVWRRNLILVSFFSSEKKSLLYNNHIHTHF